MQKIFSHSILINIALRGRNTLNQNQFIHTMRKVYVRRLILPLLFLAILFALLFRLPILNCIFPTSISENTNVNELFAHNEPFVEISPSALHYSGYDYMRGTHVKGHYYYTLVNGRCTIYLISCNVVGNTGQPPATLEQSHFKARLISKEDMLKDLLTLMAGDMSWNYNSIRSITAPIIISELNYTLYPVVILGILLLLAFPLLLAHILFTLYSIIHPLHYSDFPGLASRAEFKVVLNAALSELEQDCFVAGNIYISEHYLYYIHYSSITIIPIAHIVRIYHLNAICGLPMRRYIASSLHIITSSKPHFRFRKLVPANADAIVAKLIDLKPDILTGLSSQ